MKKWMSCFMAVCFASAALAVSLTDAPNEASTAKVKEVINENNATLEQTIATNENRISSLEAGAVTNAITRVNVTNGQPVTLTYRYTELYGINSAADATNTITINAGTAGTMFTLICGSSTNPVTIADSAPCFLSAAATMHSNDVLNVYFYKTNVLVETSRSTN